MFPPRLKINADRPTKREVSLPIRDALSDNDYLRLIQTYRNIQTNEQLCISKTACAAQKFVFVCTSVLYVGSSITPVHTHTKYILLLLLIPWKVDSLLRWRNKLTKKTLKHSVRHRDGVRAGQVN